VQHEELNPSADAPDDSKQTSGLLQQNRVRLGAIVALAVAGGLIAWAVTGNSSNAPSAQSPSTQQTNTSPTANTGPVALSARGLQIFAKKSGQPVYWAGTRRRYTYEVTQTPAGKVFVRYLPRGVKAGARGARYLIIATYPFPEALKGLKAVSGGKEIGIPGKGIAVVDPSYPKSVHMAFPRVDYQVEVYDPSPAASLHVALSGQVRPVGSS
jgi:hypothetical protein